MLQQGDTFEANARSTQSKGLGIQRNPKTSASEALRARKHGIQAGSQPMERHDQGMLQSASDRVGKTTQLPVEIARAFMSGDVLGKIAKSSDRASTTKAARNPNLAPTEDRLDGENTVVVVGGSKDKLAKHPATARQSIDNGDAMAAPQASKPRDSRKQPSRAPPRDPVKEDRDDKFELSISPEPVRKTKAVRSKPAATTKTKKPSLAKIPAPSDINGRNTRSRLRIEVETGSSPRTKASALSTRATRAKAKPKATAREDAAEALVAPTSTIHPNSNALSIHSENHADEIPEHRSLIEESLEQFENSVFNLDARPVLMSSKNRTQPDIPKLPIVARDQAQHDVSEQPDKEDAIHVAEFDLHRQAIAREHFPQTPMAISSSPPTTHQEVQAPANTDLQHEGFTRKTNLIGFARDGPRNQGTLSMKRFKKDADHSMYPEIRAPCVASTTRTVKSSRKAPPSNVAGNTKDALAAFRKNAPGKSMSSAVGHTIIPSRSGPSRVAKEAVGAYNDEDFTSIDDWEGPTLMEPDNSTHAEKVSAPTEGLTASQIVMPPPGLLPTKVPKSVNLVESSILEKGISAKPFVEVKLALNPKSKRAIDAAHLEESVTKRPKMDTVQQHATVTSDRPDRVDNVLKKMAFDRSPQASQYVESGGSRTSMRRTVNPSRHASGSQTVDVQGSPIPVGMEHFFTDNRTVLEVLSHSQQLLPPSEPSRRMSSPEFDAIVDNHFSFSSRRPKRVSSNNKPMPASPNEKSRTATKVVIRESEVEELVDQSNVHADLFKSTDSARQHSPTEFGKRLLLMTHKHDPCLTIPEVDPDQTLVEPSKSFLRQASDSGSTTDSVQSAGILSDIGKWRDCIRPDQANVFDELVSISHKLVQHLVDVETARSGMVDDYHKRGLHVIQTMEAAHIEQYQRHGEQLRTTKGRVGKKLASCHEKLYSSVAAVKKMMEQRDKSETYNHDVEGALQDIVVSYC